MEEQPVIVVEGGQIGQDQEGGAPPSSSADVTSLGTNQTPIQGAEP